MDPDHPEIRLLRDTIAALRTQLKACDQIGDVQEREQMIRILQTEIAYAERVIQLKLDDGSLTD